MPNQRGVSAQQGQPAPFGNGPVRATCRRNAVAKAGNPHSAPEIATPRALRTTVRIRTMNIS